MKKSSPNFRLAIIPKLHFYEAMQSRKLEDLTNFIESRKAEVEIKILQLGRERSFRRRPRDPEEIEVLNQICLLRWKKAEAEGKIRYISKTQWYYDPS